MLNENQLYTIILLVVLGFLIMYLFNPDSTCKSNNNYDYNDNLEKFTVANDNNSTQNPNLTQFPNLSSSQNISNNSEILPLDNQDSNYEQFIPSTLKPVQQNLPTLQPKLNNSEINGNEYNVGADISNAYNVLQEIPTQKDVVNINNVKEYNAKDFLPKEINNDWFDTDFSQAKQNLKDDNLINTDRYVIGINTVGQSLKNASYDIRGTVPNPKFTVSPWNNSTYEADLNIKPLY